eukprot:Nitzschia sp. Nitz4//scaffold283_size24287//10128//11271//NITZ4_008403-RA/size24287-augustus-gene-0.32-mRNA-1//-1//CDS//3329545648//4729//frame0
MDSARHRQSSGVYPLHPAGSQVIVRYNPDEMTWKDRVYVLVLSLVVVGGVAWVPAVYVWAWKKLRSIPKSEKKKRAIYAGVLVAITVLFVAGPHRSRKFGDWIRIHDWSAWKACYRYFAFEVVADQGLESVKHIADEQSIVGISPHGLFPFGLAFAATSQVFGKVRIMAASATQMVPFLRDLLRMLHVADASKHTVDRVLRAGHSIALVPGGIAEMFEGYPKAGSLPDEEVVLVGKGMFRMALKYGLPVFPVFCFGSSKLLRRIQLPSIVEKISLLLRMSIVIMYGRGYLPVPFRQKLMYVVGRPIDPGMTAVTSEFDSRVDEMFAKYCSELLRIFNRQKESYGWAHKSLKIIER